MLRSLSAASRPFGARAFSAAGSEKIAMVGSGNFGSALVRILGRNATRHDVFDNEVKMYVHEEMIDGVPLTKIINETTRTSSTSRAPSSRQTLWRIPALRVRWRAQRWSAFAFPTSSSSR